MNVEQRVRELREVLLLRVARCTTPGDAPAIQGGIEELAEIIDRYRQALDEIARHPLVERNPDGEDQAAHTMRLIAREALAASKEET